jgi:hypothetical protein
MVSAPSPIEAIEARCRVTNPASRRVIQKSGFQYQGNGMVPSLALGGSLPVEWYRLDRKTWISLRSWGRSDERAHPRQPALSARRDCCCADPNRAMRRPSRRHSAITTSPTCWHACPSLTTCRTPKTGWQPLRPAMGTRMSASFARNV